MCVLCVCVLACVSMCIRMCGICSVCVLGECLVFSFHWGGTEKNTTNMSVSHVFVFGHLQGALEWGSVG